MWLIASRLSCYQDNQATIKRETFGGNPETFLLHIWHAFWDPAPMIAETIHYKCCEPRRSNFVNLQVLIVKDNTCAGGSFKTFCKGRQGPFM